MDFNLPPVNQSGFHPVNPPSGASNGSYPPNERALYDAMEEFNAELQAALKEGPSADLTKLTEAGKRLEQLRNLDYNFFPNDVHSDFFHALMWLGGDRGNFRSLMAACANGIESKIKSDFSAIFNSPDIQNQIKNSFNTFHQAYPPPSSNYNATEQAFLDLTAFLQQIFNTSPQPDPNDPAMVILCQNLLQLQTELKKSGDSMYNTFESKAPWLLIKLIQDANSPFAVSRDIAAIQADWGSVNADIQAFLNKPVT